MDNLSKISDKVLFVYFSESQTNLGKVGENLVFGQELFVFLEVVKKLIQIPSVGVLHDDAQLILGGVVNLLELYDILVFDHVMELSLKQSLFFLLGLEVSDVDAFHYVVFVVLQGTFNQIDFAHGALSQDFDLSVLLLFGAGWCLTVVQL
jgi:hypothetical protein